MVDLTQIQELKNRLEKQKGKKEVLEQKLVSQTDAIKNLVEELKPKGISSVDEAKSAYSLYLARAQNLTKEIDIKLTELEGIKNV